MMNDQDNEQGSEQSNEQSNEQSKKAPFTCFTCGCRHFYVVYTRPRRGYILRVRACRHCGRRIVTREHE